MSTGSVQHYKSASKVQINPERDTSPVIFLDQASGWGSPVSLRNEKPVSPSNSGQQQYFSEKVKSVTPFSPQVKGVLKNKQDPNQYFASTASKSLMISESSTPQNINKLLHNFLSTRNSINVDKKIDFNNISTSQLSNDFKDSTINRSKHTKSPSVNGINSKQGVTGSHSQQEYKKQIDILCKKIAEQSKKIEGMEKQMQNQKEQNKEFKEIQSIYQKQKIIIEQQVEVERQYKQKIDELQSELSSKKNTIECLKIDHIQELQSIYEKNQQEVASLRQSMAPTNTSGYESTGKVQQLQNFNSTITVKSQIMEDSINLMKNKKSSEVQELLQKLHKIDENTANLITFEREEKAYLHQRVKELNLKIIELEQQALEKEEWCQKQINQESDKIYKFFEKESSKQDIIKNQQKEVLKMTYEEQLNQVQELFQKQKSRNKDMANELQKQVKENEQLMQRQQEIEQQNQQINSINQLLKNQNIEFSSIIASQKQRINQDIEELAALNNQVLNQSNEIQLLSIKNASLEGQVKELSSYRQEQQELGQKFLNLQKDHSILNQTFEEQKAIFLELQTDNKILQDQLNHFRSNELGDQIEQFKRGCSEDELKFKIQHLEKILQEKEIYIQEIIEIQNQGAENFDKKSAGYLAQQKELLQQQEDLKEQNYSLQTELEKLRTQYKTLENQHLETLTTQREQINDLYIQLQKSQLESKGEESELIRAQQQILQSKSDYNKLKSNYNMLEVEKERLEFQVEELKLDNQRADILQEQNNHYKEQSDELLTKFEIQSKTITTILSLEEALSQMHHIE